MPTRISYHQFDRFRLHADSVGFTLPDSSVPPTFASWEAFYDSSGLSIIPYCKATSITFDDSDSLGLDLEYDFSSTMYTMDYDRNYYWDSDSDSYASQIASRAV